MTPGDTCKTFKDMGTLWDFWLLQEGEGEKHQCVVASHAPPSGSLACNLDMCPDWESNQQPFGLQAGTQSTEPHQPGTCYFSFDVYWLLYFLKSMPFLLSESVLARFTWFVLI